MHKPTCGVHQYIYFIDFGLHVPDKIEPLALNLLCTIPGVEHATIINHDGAELLILQEYLDELDDTKKFWDSLKVKVLEVADITQAACLLYAKVGEE